MQSAKYVSRLAGAGLVAALVTACGSSGAGNSVGVVTPSGGGSKIGGRTVSAQELLAGSVDRTESTKNAALRLDFTGSFDGTSVSFGGDGIADFAAKKFQLTMNLPAGTGVSGNIEELVIGSVFYLKLPEVALPATGGKPWVKIDASSLGAVSGGGLGSLGQDPTQFLNTLRNVSDSVTKVGTARVRGVETTHYRAQVDLSKAVAASGAGTSSLGQLQKSLGTATLPEDVYLDSEGRARRIAVSLTPPAGSPTGLTVGSFSTTVDLFNFGTTDTSGIVAPPADQIGKLPGTGSATD